MDKLFQREKHESIPDYILALFTNILLNTTQLEIEIDKIDQEALPKRRGSRLFSLKLFLLVR